MAPRADGEFWTDPGSLFEIGSKTRLLPFRRPPASQRGGKGPATFDFLGFTLYWGRARSGRWCMWCKTRRSRLARERSGSRPTGVDAIDTYRSACNTPRSRDASRDTSTTSASVATTAVSCHWSKRQGGTGSSGSAVEATDRVSRGRGTRRYWSATLCPNPGSAYGSGGRSHEPHQRRSRMVPNPSRLGSKSGSGEGPG